MKKPFKLTVSLPWWMQLFLIVPFTVFSIFTLIVALQGSQGSENALCGFLFFAGPFTILGWTTALSNIQLTEENVTVSKFSGRFRIAWDEVERISLNGHHIALIGNNKRLVLSLEPINTNVTKMVEFINQKIEQKGIKAETDPQLKTTQKNTRV